MTHTSPANGTSDPMLRWVFRHGAQVLTCEIDALDNRSYDVSVVPHWNVSATVIEHFDRALSAIERHASIARRLRADGWVVIDHAVPDHVGIAA